MANVVAAYAHLLATDDFHLPTVPHPNSTFRFVLPYNKNANHNFPPNPLVANRSGSNNMALMLA